MLYTTNSEQETKKLAQQLIIPLAKDIESRGVVLFLQGDFGSGKTTFTKGVASHFGLKENTISSPSYTYRKEYTINQQSLLVHMDLWRVKEPETLKTLITSEPVKNKLFIVEWPESFYAELLNWSKEATALLIRFSVDHENDQIHYLDVSQI